jgi:RNA polymerase sigma factor (sigma-70 family)
MPGREVESRDLSPVKKLLCRCQRLPLAIVCSIMAGVPHLESANGMEAEQDLVERARLGELEAAERLLLRHELAVHRACAHLLPRGEDVEGAVQETFLRALRSLTRYSGAGSFGGWLVSIALNYCRDRLRRKRLVPFVTLERDDGDEGGVLAVASADGPDPERVAMARQAAARVRSELRRLPQRQREVFTLRFFVGLELEGIASALAVDVGTVKTHLHRAVRRVRTAVEEARP